MRKREREREREREKRLRNEQELSFWDLYPPQGSINIRDDNK